MRCWGRGSPQAVRGLQFERSDCEMDSRIFVSGALLTGYLTVRHEAYDGSKLGALRFAERYSASFRNEFMGRDDRHRTAPRCVERSVDRDGLPLRAVVCLRAYKKLEGLHDLSVLVATLDGSAGRRAGPLRRPRRELRQRAATGRPLPRRICMDRPEERLALIECFERDGRPGPHDRRARLAGDAGARPRQPGRAGRRLRRAPPRHASSPMRRAAWC